MSHALTARAGFLRENFGVLTLSGVAHLGLLLLLALNLNLMPRRPLQPVRLAIQATVVDSRALQQQADARQRDERRVEEQRLAELEKRQAAERQAEEQRAEQIQEKDKEKLQAQQRQEQQQKERQDAVRRETEQRRVEAAKTQKAKVDEARKLATDRQRAADDARHKAEADQRQARVKSDLARQMADEERLNAAAQSGLLDQYAEVIRQKVERNWIRPVSARAGIHCVVNVKQIPGGEVVDVRVGECNGDAAVVRSIEAAVLRSSPLPPPPDAALFDRSLRFEFKPQE